MLKRSEPVGSIEEKAVEMHRDIRDVMHHDVDVKLKQELHEIEQSIVKKADFVEKTLHTLWEELYQYFLLSAHHFDIDRLMDTDRPHIDMCSHRGRGFPKMFSLLHNLILQISIVKKMKDLESSVINETEKTDTEEKACTCFNAESE